MLIGLIGCGRVGVTIFSILKEQHKITGVYDVVKENEKNAARLLKVRDNPVHREIVRRSQALFIATPDDMIRRAYMKLLNDICGAKYIFHFSGLHPAEVLPKKKGIYRASIHPFASFPALSARPGKKHFLLFVQGDVAAVRKARAIFNPRYFTLRTLKRKDKTMCHLTGVFASNLLVGLVSSVNDIARKIGWKDKEIKRFVFPLIAEALKNFEHNGPDKALSGPLQRGDTRTVEIHLKALRKDKELLAIYKSLSLYILNNLTSASKKTELKKLLEE